MYRKGEVRYQALPLPDRVQLPPEASLKAAQDFLAYDPIMNIYRDHVSRFDEADQRKILSENAQRLYRVL